MVSIKPGLSLPIFPSLSSLASPSLPSSLSVPSPAKNRTPIPLTFETRPSVQDAGLVSQGYACTHSLCLRGGVGAWFCRRLRAYEREGERE
eukprot:962199-Amorphochlora_amoeboformis.AAC.1